MLGILTAWRKGFSSLAMLDWDRVGNVMYGEETLFVGEKGGPARAVCLCCRAYSLCLCRGLVSRRPAVVCRPSPTLCSKV